MKGNEITEARGRLGLSRTDFARILHVAQSTAFRWENSNVPRMDPLQRKLVELMIEAGKLTDAWQRGQALRAGLEREPAFALYVLLQGCYSRK